MNIKSLLIDFVGLVGFVALCAGLFLQFGLGIALIIAGSMSVGYAIWVAN